MKSAVRYAPYRLIFMQLWRPLKYYVVILEVTTSSSIMRLWDRMVTIN